MTDAEIEKLGKEISDAMAKRLREVSAAFSNRTTKTVIRTVYEDAMLIVAFRIATLRMEQSLKFVRPTNPEN